MPVAIKNNFDPTKIVHDPVMEQLFYQAVREQIELEIKLVKESKNEKPLEN